MKACEHEYENANCTNCANGLPCSEFECAKTKGTMKEYCHNKAEEIHQKYYQKGRADAIDEVLSFVKANSEMRSHWKESFSSERVYESVIDSNRLLEKLEQLKEQRNG